MIRFVRAGLALIASCAAVAGEPLEPRPAIYPTCLQRAFGDAIPGLRIPPPLHSDPLEEFLLWEELYNLPRFRQPTEPVAMAYSLIPSPKLDVRIAKGGEKLLEKFVEGDFVRVPKHPRNTQSEVPFFGEKSAGEWNARYTASRSLVVAEDPKEPFSVKLATNFPHKDNEQPLKAFTKSDVWHAVRRTELIDEVNRRYGRPTGLTILRDVLTIADRESGEGFVVRDLAPLKGKRVLPGTAIPFYPALGADYAQAVGRAKAQMLLHYGVEMVTPNSQNFLLDLSAGVPGRELIVRDVGDTAFVGPIAKVLFSKNDFATLKKSELVRPKPNPRGTYPKTEQVKTYFSHLSFMFFEEGGVPAASVRAWELIHDRAYAHAVLEGLGLPVSRLIPDKNPLDSALEILLSPEGLKALRNTRLRPKKQSP